MNSFISVTLTIAGKNRSVKVMMVIVIVKQVLVKPNSMVEAVKIVPLMQRNRALLCFCFNVSVQNVNGVAWLWRFSLILNEGWQFYKYRAEEGQMLLQMLWSTGF